MHIWLQFGCTFALQQTKESRRRALQPWKTCDALDGTNKKNVQWWTNSWKGHYPEKQKDGQRFDLTVLIRRRTDISMSHDVFLRALSTLRKTSCEVHTSGRNETVYLEPSSRRSTLNSKNATVKKKYKCLIKLWFRTRELHLSSLNSCR